MISNIQASPVSSSSTVILTQPISMSDSTPAQSAIASTDTVKVSTLSRQLSDSAARAEVRDKNTSRGELGDMARKLKDDFLGDSYNAQRVRHDAEKPETDDPDLLARARHATAYVNLASTGDRSTKSPFADLTTEQLALIIYDDSGSYTVNERRAAAYDANDIEQKWRVEVIAQSRQESEGNVNTPKFYAEVLSHYKSLPPIEQAQYPGDYETRLLGRISEGGGVQNTEDDRLLTLFEVLANIQLPEKESGPTVPGLRMNSLSPDVSPTPAAVLRS
ncbi:hypothetical protein QN400_17995 [Pseudomonas sp. RTC3]|uniref:hypothetical protein n=1 Tax=unclassified Pseudomonas TaxID=196821 RepID=UPI002AB56AF2|nr:MULTISPECIES: hypothetical protein [unclassified Pseudomonas]MEB0063909.1 hypothetical protein [Pseudomonas sp. RTC3]MDY7567674.1 hypothetical protein [Pseudomonas sp. 5C2]MEB0007690.1 hypothetical protein [Pseudomonas sp. RTB2]MEB0018689.1 hypothetical protein [Pseudomonas sp. RTB3]MEB0150257.1 hypothetical protein [Pseudomonas sp. CCC2.2]